MKTDLEQTINDRVTNELTPVDMKRRLDNWLDEVFDFGVVGGPFAYMQPSRVLREMDPIAYRCAVADLNYESENVVEINGDLYDVDEVQKIRDEVEAEAETAEEDDAS